jgi:hypothetical protein
MRCEVQQTKVEKGREGEGWAVPEFSAHVRPEEGLESSFPISFPYLMSTQHYMAEK